MNTLIITGGNINEEFIKEYLQQNRLDTIIAADKGLETLYKLQIEPSFIIGDFDSLDTNILKHYKNKNIPITYLNSEKDYTDTHMAIKKAIEIGSTSITILGAIGTRIDHTLANIHILKEALDNIIKACIVNNNNKIMLINRTTTIEKNNKYKYVSIIPLTTQIKGVTLTGFKYPLNNATIEVGLSLGISNEQIEEQATIEIEEGIAILVFSKD